MKPVAGIGLRSPHVAEIGRDLPAIGFLEIHAENHLTGSPARQAIERLRADYAFSVHAVGLSLGSVEGLDEAHLARVAALVERLEPALVSDHLSWSTFGGRCQLCSVQLGRSRDFDHRNPVGSGHFDHR